MILSLIFGYHAVIGASAFDGVCEYVSQLINAASDRALATGSLPLTEEQVAGLRELFFDVSEFANKKGKSPAINQLEEGAINRRQFINLAQKEFVEFMNAATCEGSTITADGKYAPLQDKGFARALREMYDPECILCVLEKTPLRKNVLNLIHFLRTKFQDVKIGVVCNNWEAEGSYVANSMAARRTGMPVFIPGTCPQEYRDVNDTFKTKRFTTNGLFDVVSQSYVLRSRKPSTALLKQAIEGLTEMTAVANDTSSSRVYVFEGRSGTVSAAGKVDRVAKCYHIDNGPIDLYNAVCDAVKDLAKYDARWGTASAQLTRVIGPLFKAYPVAEGWRKAELANNDGNLLYLPPPIDARLEKVEGIIVGPVHRAILSDLRDRVPQCFPLSDADIAAASGSSYGTAGGPVLFERYRTTVLPDAYRITLKTGSFIVRVEPKGGPKAAALSTLSQSASIPRLIQAGMSHAHGGTPLAQTFRITKHFAGATTLPVKEGIAFIASEVNSIGRDFYVQRYIDGKTLSSVSELVQPFVVRGYSQSRTKAEHTPCPTLFMEAALDVMTKVHGAPVPEDLFAKEAAMTNCSDHPLLHVVKQFRSLSLRKNAQPPESVEKLGRALLAYLEKERSPTTSQLTLTHGFLSLESFMFAHRSLEGRPECPVEVVGVTNLGSCEIGDPLLDLAALTIITKAPLPEGIVGLPVGARSVFPTEDKIIDRYLSKAAANGVRISSTPEEVKNSINIYQAVHCYRRSCVLFYGSLTGKMEGNEAHRRLSTAERSAKLGLAILIGNTKSPKLKSKL